MTNAINETVLASNRFLGPVISRWGSVIFSKPACTNVSNLFMISLMDDPTHRLQVWNEPEIVGWMTLIAKIV